MEFTLKHYKKQASIQLKPTINISADKSRCVHFSIAWFRGSDIPKPERKKIMIEIFTSLSEYFEKNGNTLTFKIVKIGNNCTYGHFDQGFEDIITKYRSLHALNTEKDLPLDQFPDLPDIPVMFHIAHSRSTDSNFDKFMKNEDNILEINVSLLEVNK